MQPQMLEEWKSLDGRARWARYRPKAVRDALDATRDVLYSEERYSRVSELATHVTPETRPQAHNPFGIPSQATIFQMAGLLISLNEAALVTCLVTVPATALIDHGRDMRLQLLNAGKRLAEQLGGADVLEIDEYYEQVRRSART
jgi:hypothetical protein